MELVSPRDISNESVKNNNKNPKTTKQKKKKSIMDQACLKLKWTQTVFGFSDISY